MRAAAPAAAVMAGPGAAQDFDAVGALFAERCVICHSGEDAPLGLRLDTLDGVLAGSENGPVVRAGDAASPLLQRLRGEAEPQMPLDGPPWLPEDDIRLIRDWIAQGAPDDAGRTAPIPEGARIRLRGVLTGAAEIDGAAFVIDGGTRVDDRPRIGDQAEMRGVVQADGTVRAERFRDR